MSEINPMYDTYSTIGVGLGMGAGAMMSCSKNMTMHTDTTIASSGHGVTDRPSRATQHTTNQASNPP